MMQETDNNEFQYSFTFLLLTDISVALFPD